MNSVLGVVLQKASEIGIQCVWVWDGLRAWKNPHITKIFHILTFCCVQSFCWMKSSVWLAKYISLFVTKIHIFHHFSSLNLPPKWLSSKPQLLQLLIRAPHAALPLRRRPRRGPRHRGLHGGARLQQLGAGGELTKGGDGVLQAILVHWGDFFHGINWDSHGIPWDMGNMENMKYMKYGNGDQ